MTTQEEEVIEIVGEKWDENREEVAFQFDNLVDAFAAYDEVNVLRQHPENAEVTIYVHLGSGYPTMEVIRAEEQRAARWWAVANGYTNIAVTPVCPSPPPEEEAPAGDEDVFGPDDDLPF